jgi:hypothetical protein
VTYVVRPSCGEVAYVEGAFEDTIAEEGSAPPPEDTTAGEGVLTYQAPPQDPKAKAKKKSDTGK